MPPEEVKLPVEIDQMEADSDGPERIQEEEDPAEITEEVEVGTPNLQPEEVGSLTT